MDQTKHNAYKKLMKLCRQGKIPLAALTEVDIYHDNWCRIHKGGYCNCDPDIKLRRQLAGKGRDNGHAQAAAGSAQGPRKDDTRPLKPPTAPCPHCGSKEFIIWQTANDPQNLAIGCDGCGAVMSSTHPLDPDDRPMRRP